MALAPSTMPGLGKQAPGFSLPDTDGRTVSLSDFRQAPALLVMFICNHCPYVKHVQQGLAALCAEYQKRGVAVVGISSNEIAGFPEDGPDPMKVEKAAAGYTFPYLF